MAPTLRLALITVAATLAYLGLAILGWGGFADFFSHSALIALTIVLFALSGVAIFSGGNLSRGVREDRANRWVIVAFGLIGLLAAYLPAYTDRKGFWTLDGDAIRWLGVVLFAAGGALRIWPVFVLGHRFSGLVTIQPGHKLVTSGVYGSSVTRAIWGCSLPSAADSSRSSDHCALTIWSASRRTGPRWFSRLFNALGPST
jgi:Isoprenylcysteine carboxyl methyltransferase (ICMT) family